MRVTYFTINVGAVNSELAAELAQALMPLYRKSGIVMNGQVSIIDDDPEANTHIDPEPLSVPDMAKLGK